MRQPVWRGYGFLPSSSIRLVTDAPPFWLHDAHWKQGQGAFEEKPAGAVIWHASNVHHATKTAEHPLLTVWSWTRDTHTPAKLVDA